jgi:F0F1-type ATP synthase gamma subunit
MAKAAKIKSDLDDVTSLVEIFQILKDVAANHFYNTAKRKERFLEFAEAFTEFFRMVSLSEATSPLVYAQNDKVGVIAITSEGGFMADMTAKIVKASLLEAEKHDVSEFVVIGYKGEEKLRLRTEIPLHVIRDVEEKGLYKIALETKQHIIKQVEEKKFSKVFGVYPKAMKIDFIKPMVIKLLPSEELITRQQGIKDVVEKVIVESTVNNIITHLADIWLTCRVYEMLEDCVIAGFAAQSQQLESSLEKLKGDQKGLLLSFRKAQKSEIDKSLREVFTASMVTGR